MIRALYLTSFQVNKRGEDDDLLAFLIDYDHDFIPLTNEGKIVLFVDRNLVGRVLSLSDADVEGYTFDKDSVFSVKYAAAVELLEFGKYDTSSTILNVLNTFDDVLKGLGIIMPSEVKQNLYALADYLTFDNDLDLFYREALAEREKALQNVRWCFGAILSRAKLIM